MRFVDVARTTLLLSLAALLSACPKKDSDAVPEPASPAAVQAPSDKAGAEAPAAAVPAAEAPAAVAPAAPAAAPPVKAKKRDEDKGGGW